MAFPLAVVARLRQYAPPPTCYYDIPPHRRAAVLILLYITREGNLQVLLTLRASTLSSYAGQTALPGGKADSWRETAYETALREAREEIGLHLPTLRKRGFELDYLCELPISLARTGLAVRPCVAFLGTRGVVNGVGNDDNNVGNGGGGQGAAESDDKHKTTDLPAETAVIEDLVPWLDGREVAAVYSAPFGDFLKASVTPAPNSDDTTAIEHHKTLVESASTGNTTSILSPSSLKGLDSVIRSDTKPTSTGTRMPWYQGEWLDWFGKQWRMHNFFVPTEGAHIFWATDRPGPGRRHVSLSYDSRPENETATTTAEGRRPNSPHTEIQSQLTSSSPNPLVNRPTGQNHNSSLQPNSHHAGTSPYFRVFGMTARILVDAARIGYARDPEFEHNTPLGEENLVHDLLKSGEFDRDRSSQRRRKAEKLADGSGSDSFMGKTGGERDRKAHEQEQNIKSKI